MRLSGCCGKLATMGVVGVALVPAATATAATKPRASRATARLFNVPTANAGLQDIVAGPDGALWFTETKGHKLGRISTSGQITEYPIPSEGLDGPEQLVVSGGQLWFLNDSGEFVVRASPTDPGNPVVVRQSSTWAQRLAPAGNGGVWFSTWPDDDVLLLDPTSGAEQPYAQDTMDDSYPATFAAGAAGSVWMTQHDDDRDYIRSLSPDGQPGSIALPQLDPTWDVTSIAYDGHTTMWFTEYAPASWALPPRGGAVGWIDGNLAAHVVDLHNDWAPQSITPGPDGAMWFSEKDGIGRISTTGRVSHFSIKPYQPDRIVAGPDKALWFIDSGANRIGRIPLPKPKRKPTKHRPRHTTRSG